MQLTINSFKPLFPDTSLTFSKIPDISLTAVKIPDISRFSSQVVSLVVTIISIMQAFCETHNVSSETRLQNHVTRLCCK